ncbi:MAG TPA: F0F1 ATP synthase subunit alpha [Anaerolineales bacterium]|nr:F0F1 ATP synthase subunit alpha [Anaerolineae bacterium]HIQ01880.1 F0F1 ATP synthase subunit alpha [Anaerolineales bacterium]
MANPPNEQMERIAALLRERIEQFEPTVAARDVGTVTEVGDGITRVSGLTGVQMSELVSFPSGVLGMAFDLEVDNVGVIIMGDYTDIDEGDTVRRTGRIVSVPVGDALLGRVVDALGRPVDGKGPILTDRYRPVEHIAAGVVERQNVDTPVQTGIKAIDAMIPIGRGQRELIIGDRQTGKTAIAIDTIINQKGKDLLCIYVAIGQKRAQVRQVVATLERYGAMDHTVVVVASASEPAALQYIAPYAGCAIGEAFMETGRDALVVYDDLSKHAWAYRQVSLLLRRPPGREAYPGDIFYLHSRLLERAARLANHYIIVPKDAPPDATEGVDGKSYLGPLGYEEAKERLKELGEGHEIRKKPGTGGSLTALPIVETLLGDVTAYIPTNVISITDGQIYLETDLFNAGIRPAINVGISVSRVGGDAQTKAMKQVAGGLRLDMARYQDLAAFAQFGSDLDEATQRQLDRGQRLTEILKQPQYEPVPLEEQVIIIYAGTHGYCDIAPVNRVREYEQSLLRYMRTEHPEIGDEIAARKVLTEEAEQALQAALETFNEQWSAR